jgi:endonuclease/exonuclease/phosphatase family metal-dependent hydrolase
MDLPLISYNVNAFPWVLPAPPIKDIVAWIVRTCSLTALQEVWANHAAWSAAFAAHGWVFLRPAREQHFASVFGSGLAFAWNPTRFSLQDARFYPFLATSGLDIMLVRGWFQAELMNSAGQSIRIVNTHLQADLDIIESFTKRFSDVARKQQARQLMACLEKQEQKPTLIVGDMNTEQSLFGSYPYLGSDTVTYPATGRVFDRCVGIGPWTLKSHRVFDDKDWSDHYPVLWTFM